MYILPQKSCYMQKGSLVQLGEDCTLGPSCSSILSWHFQNCEAGQNRLRGGASLEGQEYLQDVDVNMFFSFKGRVNIVELTGDRMIHPMSVIDPLQCWLIQPFVQQLES